MIYKFLVDVKDSEENGKQFKIRTGVFELEQPADNPEWYQALDRKQISVLFARDVVVFTSNDGDYLDGFRQGMQYCTTFPKEYEQYFKEYPNLA